MHNHQKFLLTFLFVIFFSNCVYSQLGKISESIPGKQKDLCGLIIDRAAVKGILARQDSMYREYKKKKRLGLLQKNQAIPNWYSLMSNVEEQECNNCWAHAATGVVEGLLHQYIGRNDKININETTITNNSSCGGCFGSENPACGLDYLTKNRVDVIIPGNSMPNLYAGAVSYSENTASIEEIKKSLQYSPVLAGMIVYYKFRYLYNSDYAIYDGKNETTCLGSHAVVIVGYDDDNECWICKNSWGDRWGWGGYFRIAYGTCGIDAICNVTASVNESCLPKIYPSYIPSIYNMMNYSFNANEWDYCNLSGNITIPSGNSLTIKARTKLNFNDFYIASSGGTLATENGFEVDCAYLKQNGILKGLFPKIQSAADYSNYGQTVELQRRTYNESFSLTGKSSITISGYGAAVNGIINLNNNSYCSLYGVYLPTGQVFINGDIGLIITDIRSDAGNRSLNIENSTNNAVYGLTATNGDMEDFGVNIYNSTGDICRSSRIENQMIGIFLYGTSRYNVTDDFFCQNELDVEADGGAFAYLLNNTMSRVNPASVYGNVDFDEWPTVACSSPSGMAKSNTASMSLSTQTEVKGTPADDLDRMYMGLLNRTSQDTALDYKGKIEKYKSEYLGIAEKSKGELKKNLRDLSKLKSSLSLTVNCLRYLGEDESLSSYVSELLGMSDVQPYAPYIKKYLIPGLIGKKDFTGTLAQCDEILNSKDIDKDLTCEMLYEKGIINRFFIKNNTEAYRAFSSITANYPDHPLGKMAMGQISDMPGIEVEKPGLKSLSSNSEGFTCSSYPNPFNPTTRFTFSIPVNAFTELKIYNSLGQEVKTLVSDYLSKGKYTFEWNAKSYSSGIYYYFLKSGNNVTTSKIILLK